MTLLLYPAKEECQSRSAFFFWIPAYDALDLMYKQSSTVISCEGSRDFLSRMGIYGRIVYTPSHSEDKEVEEKKVKYDSANRT